MKSARVLPGGLGVGEIRGLGGGGGLGMDLVWFKYTFYMVKIDTTSYLM